MIDMVERINTIQKYNERGNKFDNYFMVDTQSIYVFNSSIKNLERCKKNAYGM